MRGPNKLRMFHQGDFRLIENKIRGGSFGDSIESVTKCKMQAYMYLGNKPVTLVLCGLDIT